MSSTTATTTRVELLRRIVQDARQVLDGTMADATQAQVNYLPRGIANPLGATYVQNLGAQRHSPCARGYPI